MPSPKRIGLVAGEASGDQLGAPLIAELKKRYPDAVFEGIGGKKMMAQGLKSLFPMERLSVMGLVDPLKRLPELLAIRKSLFQHFYTNHFDLVVGIDAPDFNLGLELRLRQKGVSTAHYVSPSVWAWRQGRIKKIALAVDRMLTLLPFEAQFYRDHNVPVTFVGHSLAEQFPDRPNTAVARRKLALDQQQTVIAVMPGSRSSEVKSLAPLFLEAARRCADQLPNVIFVLPAASAALFDQLTEILVDFNDLPLKLMIGDSHLAMEAADAVLLASGTTALEAMLFKKPMVVCYRMGGFSYRILSRLIKTAYISLPNLLAGKELVPELIQDQATVENISSHLLQMINDRDLQQDLVEAFSELHQQLRLPSSVIAADALADLIGEPLTTGYSTGEPFSGDEG